MTNGTPGGDAPRPPEPPAPLKRFYKTATIGPLVGGGATVLLDGRPIRTPARAQLVAPAPVAEAMAAEWNAQEVHILPLTMPLTRLANTAIDGVASNMEPVREEIVAIGSNDLVFYRADAPAGLVERQQALWDPLVNHMETRLDVPVEVTAGIMPIYQSPAFSERLRALLPAEPLPLAALHQLTTLTGSALIALAVAEGVQSLDAGWDAAHVDEDWNIKEWGEDAEAAERRAMRRRDAEAAAFILREML